MSLGSQHRRPSAPAFDLEPAPAPSAGRDREASHPPVSAERDRDELALGFDGLYETYLDHVWHSARRLGVEPSQLEDVVQEVFIVVHRQLPGFEGRSSLRTWLYGITLHIVRNHRRRKRRKPLDVSESAAIAMENEPISERHRPDVVVERRDDEARLARVLEALPDELREVLVMAELQEMSGPEIATVTGLKPATVYGRLRTARRKLNDIVSRLRAGGERRTS